MQKTKREVVGLFGLPCSSGGLRTKNKTTLIIISLALNSKLLLKW